MHLLNSINSSMNLSQSTFQGPTMATYTILSIFSIIGIVMNLFFIATIYRNKNFRITSYLLLCNKSIADTLYLIIILITLFSNSLVQILNSTDNTIPIVTCKMSFWALSVSFTISASTFIIVSIDRFIKINRKSRHRSLLDKNEVLLSIILFTWLLAIFFSLPVIFNIDINTRFFFSCSIKPYRENDNIAMFIIYIINGLLCYPVTLMIVITLYYKIFKHIRFTILPSDRRKGTENYRQVKATKMIISVTVTYMITYIHLYVTWLYIGFTGINVRYFNSENVMILFLISIGLIVATLTTMENPLLFFIYNKSFRRAALKVFH